ncbi:MAG: hypothetical protein ACKPKO_24380, partial [Candidatus Fonsibacter sp.]
MFKGLLHYWSSSAVEAAISENVPALALPPPGGGCDNLSAAVTFLAPRNRWTKVSALNPMMFGVPQNRD